MQAMMANNEPANGGDAGNPQVGVPFLSGRQRAQYGRTIVEPYFGNPSQWLSRSPYYAGATSWPCRNAVNVKHNIAGKTMVRDVLPLVGVVHEAIGLQVVLELRCHTRAFRRCRRRASPE